MDSTQGYPARTTQSSEDSRYQTSALAGNESMQTTTASACLRFCFYFFVQAILIFDGVGASIGLPNRIPAVKLICLFFGSLGRWADSPISDGPTAFLFCVSVISLSPALDVGFLSLSTHRTLLPTQYFLRVDRSSHFLALAVGFATATSSWQHQRSGRIRCDIIVHMHTYIRKKCTRVLQ